VQPATARAAGAPSEEVSLVLLPYARGSTAPEASTASQCGARTPSLSPVTPTQAAPQPPREQQSLPAVPFAYG
jgi:hypothetical protein